MKRQSFPLAEGEKLNRNPNNPILTVVPDGPRSYLWIGNDAENDKMCFATLSGAQLRLLAETILDAMNPSRSRSKKQKLEDQLRQSDLTAQLTGRTDIEWGHHDSLPRGEHVANPRKEN